MDAYENDTSAVLHALHCASSDDDLLRVLSSIKGPWAFIYWQVSVPFGGLAWYESHLQCFSYHVEFHTATVVRP